MKRNILLIGMPGSGKTTFGTQLAQQLGRPFYDADDFLEEREGRSIASFFAESEAAFRDAETRSIRALAGLHGIIVAAGGGVIKRPENIDIFKRSGVVIFIDRKPDDIVSDVEIASRPLLAQGTGRVYVLYQERIAAYRKAADYIVANTGTEEMTLQDLLNLIKTYDL